MGAMMHLPDPVALATPFFILLVIAEMIYARLSGRARFEPRDTAASLLMGFGSVVFGGAFAFMFLGIANALEPYRVTDLGWSWLAIAACFVIDDFIYYWWHRASHHVGWLWATHSVHHTAPRMNALASVRQGWTDIVSGTWLVCWVK